MILPALSFFIFVLIQQVHPHSRLKFPPPRSDDSNLKMGRCGEKPKGSTVTTLSPGWMTIEFEETISHTGNFAQHIVCLALATKQNKTALFHFFNQSFKTSFFFVEEAKLFTRRFGEETKKTI
jgi:hypothetical protein